MVCQKLEVAVTIAGLMEESSLIRFFMEHNARQSALYRSSDVALERWGYLAAHKTKIVVTQCSDGRLDLTGMTKSPPGVIETFRNIGGKFDFGAPYFGMLILNLVLKAVSRDRDVIFLITHHWSKGDKYRGCRGFGFDRDAARAHCLELIAQVEREFGSEHKSVYPIMVLIETDENALVFYGRDGSILNLAEETDLTEDELRTRIFALYPDMKERMRKDLLPLCVKNCEYIREGRLQQRPIAPLDHREQIMVFGRGGDWLHMPNRAMIAGLYRYNQAEPILETGRIQLDNLREGRIPLEDGLLLVSTALHLDEVGPEYCWAREKALSMGRFALETLSSQLPDLIPHLHVLAGVVRKGTRAFTPIAAGKDFAPVT